MATVFSCPKCRKRCTAFYIGRPDTVWNAEFCCPDCGRPLNDPAPYTGLQEGPDHPKNATEPIQDGGHVESFRHPKNVTKPIQDIDPEFGNMDRGQPFNCHVLYKGLVESPANTNNAINPIQDMDSEFCCKKCDKQFNGPVPYMGHLRSSKHLKNATEPIQGRYEPIRGRSDSIDVSGLMPRRGMPIMCHVCNVPLNSPALLEIHKKGKNHLRKVKNLEMRAQIMAAGDGGASQAGPSFARTETFRATPSASTSGHRSTIGEAAVDLSCSLCGILLFASAQYKAEHMRTFSHLRRATPDTDSVARSVNRLSIDDDQ
ncbi:zinc finger protein 346-like isoform X1 [Dermacentor albipictus]|uniref:zinc finger protein 346-like isoform X1 n=1 Tax=Dermacentor albipictus TaxID=60249 RepID=UPI0031FD5FDD